MIINDPFFARAFKAAQRSNYRVRVGAVLRKKKVPLASGFNQRRKTHPLLRKFPYVANAGLHAEMHCCLGLPAKDLEGSTIYVVRLYRNGRIAPSKPCQACQQFLETIGVSKIRYALNDQQFVEVN